MAKLHSLRAAATLTLLMTSAPGSSRGAVSDNEALMPEVQVTGDAATRPHPQDGNYSDRPLGCVEVVAPRATGNELGGYWQAHRSNARDGIPVIPNLNEPSSASMWSRKFDYDQVTRAGQEGKPGCARR